MSSFYSLIKNLQSSLPDGLRICELVAQIQVAVCRHLHKAGNRLIASQPNLNLRAPRSHPVETNSYWLKRPVFQVRVWTRWHNIRTLETAASRSEPLRGVGMDLENMQAFTVRTKLPSTSSTGNASVGREREGCTQSTLQLLHVSSLSPPLTY